MTKDELKLAIELEMDKTSLAEIVDIVAEICAEKAQHVEENWDDPELARVWSEASASLLETSDHDAAPWRIR